MKKFVWLLVIALFIAHQDVWFWEDSRLVFGVLPIGLFYHVVLSIAASLVWFLAVLFAWPADLDVDQSETHEAREAK